MPASTCSYPAATPSIGIMAHLLHPRHQPINLCLQRLVRLPQRLLELDLELLQLNLKHHLQAERRGVRVCDSTQRTIAPGCGHSGNTGRPINRFEGGRVSAMQYSILAAWHHRRAFYCKDSISTHTQAPPAAICWRATRAWGDVHCCRHGAKACTHLQSLGGLDAPLGLGANDALDLAQLPL